MSNSQPYKLILPDQQIKETWTALVDHEYLQMWATHLRKPHGGWPWHLSFAVLEFVREPPLVDDLADALEAAILSVRGVKEGLGEDRETFIVSGRPKGAALVSACTAVLDRFRPEIDAELRRLGVDIGESQQP